jgi:ABC-type dipeptide/oligopeptide/nickel transport system permease subunit
MRQRLHTIGRDHRLLVIGGVMTALIVLLAILGPLFAPYDPGALGGQILSAPSSSHLMGTDQFGRDMFSRWLNAGHTSLEIAGGSVLLALLVGGFLGLIAGYRGGWVDTCLMRVTDALLSIPLVALVIALSGIIGPNGFTVIGIPIRGAGVLVLVLGVAFLPGFVRLARASALAEMEEDYIIAARALGLGTRRVLFANLLPNVVPALVIQASFSLAVAIGSEAVVSFLGFGIQPPAASWGNLLNGAQDYLVLGAWWLLAFDAAIIVFAVLAFNIVGDGLRDLLDPRHRLTSVSEPV